MKVLSGVMIIAVATIASLIIANIPTGTDPGLGGLILLFWPPILGIVGIIIFLIISATTKDKRTRLATVTVWSIYLIYVGLGLHTDKGWPLVYW